MSWVFLFLFLMGGDFSTPERVLPGADWLESRQVNLSIDGLAATATNEGARLDFRLVALRNLAGRRFVAADECARVLLRNPDPVLRAAARDVLGVVSPPDDDVAWERALRAMPEAAFSLVVDYRRATNMLDLATVASGSSGALVRGGFKQLYGVLYPVRMRRYAMVVATNAEGQAEGGLVIASGAFSVNGFLQIAQDARMTNEIRTRDGWTIIKTPIAGLAIRDEMLIAGFGNSPDTMERLVDGWFARMRDESPGTNWLSGMALLDGGLACKLAGPAMQFVLSRNSGLKISDGELIVRLKSLASGDCMVRFAGSEAGAIALADAIRALFLALPEKVEGLDDEGLDWLRGFRIERNGGDLVVKPAKAYDLRRFLVRILVGRF